MVGSLWLDQVHVTQVRALLFPTRSWTLGRDPSVALRGALGAAMMDLECVREDRQCAPCPHADSCLISSWYDPGRNTGRSRPFTLWGTPGVGAEVGPERPLVADMTFTEPLPKPELLKLAWDRVGRVGVGHDRIPADVELMVLGGEGSGWPGPVPLRQVARVPRGVVRAKLHFDVPLQLKEAGEPTPTAVLEAMINRVRGVARRQGVRIDRWFPNRLRGYWEQLRHLPGQRFSARQQAELDLSGWTGVLVIDEDADAISDLLGAIEVVGVGRATTAGLGRVWVEWERVEVLEE